MNLNDHSQIRLNPASSKTLACIDAFYTGTGRSPYWSRSVGIETSKGR